MGQTAASRELASSCSTAGAAGLRLASRELQDLPQRHARVREAVEKFEKPLVRYVLHLTHDVEMARDVVQEAFLRLCNQPQEKISSYTAEWLYTVCRNLAIDLKRKETRMRLMTEVQEEEFATDADAPSDAMEHAESLSSVLSAMNDLPHNQQECIRLKFQHGLSYKQISKVTALTVTNVGFLIHTGLKTLRTRLAEAERHASHSAAEGSVS